MDDARNKENGILSHPLFYTIVGAIIGAFFTAVFSHLSVIDHYVSNEDLNKYIESALVKTGYVDSSILDAETYADKIEMIRVSIEDYSGTIEESIYALGYTSSEIVGLSESDRKYLLLDEAGSLYNNWIQLTDDYESLCQEIEVVSQEKSDMEEKIEGQSDLDLYASSLVMDGESMNEGNLITNAVAVIDGNTFISTGLLSTYFLDEKLTFDSSESLLIYGSEKPEKLQLNWSNMVTDSSSVTYYALGEETISMGAHTYSSGVVFGDDGCFYLHLDEQYSKITFVCGHIDDTDQADATLTFYQIAEDGLSYDKELASISLTGEMVPKEYSVTLNYTGSVKVVMSGGGYWTKYGMVDIYLYK